MRRTITVFLSSEKQWNGCSWYKGSSGNKTVEWMVGKETINYLAKISPHWQIINEHFKEIIVLNGRL